MAAASVGGVGNVGGGVRILGPCCASKWDAYQVCA
jgi:hypothetical protein